jgi:alpha-beta hydrolase superfamily lysophospholipase
LWPAPPDLKRPRRVSTPPHEPQRRGPYVDTRDGQQLFYKDWGTGAPVVFLAAWALPSDMWDYQMVPLSEQGLRCIAYDRRGHGRFEPAWNRL